MVCVVRSRVFAERQRRGLTKSLPFAAEYGPARAVWPCPNLPAPASVDCSGRVRESVSCSALAGGFKFRLQAYDSMHINRRLSFRHTVRTLSAAGAL